jgi:hypothetical protein
VPVHPTLAKSIKACPSTGLAIIAKPDGANYSKEALGNFFRESIEAAGIPVTKRGAKQKGYSAPACARRLRSSQPRAAEGRRERTKRRADWRT